MKYLNKQMVVSINKVVMELTGGCTDGETNLRAGQNLNFVEKIHVNEIFGTIIYPDIYHQAAAYMFFIIKNHIFIDGNKRTGLASAITFLEWNNILFSPFNTEEVFEYVVSIAGGENNPDTVIPEISSWLKAKSIN